jgi:glycosyltransferase involved in cell wall biosynthesis
MSTVLVAHAWKLLTDHQPNGDGLFAYGILRRLAERGHRVHVATRAVDLATPPPPGLVIHQLSRDDTDLGPREQLAYMRRLRKLLDRLGEEVDVVLQTNPVNAGVTLALPRSAPPVVLGPYFADWPLAPARGPARRARRALAAAARRALRTAQQRRAQALLVTTDAARAKIHVGGLPVATVPMAVDPEDFPAPGPRPPGRPPTAVFLANLRGHKGIFDLLEAWPEVVRRVPDARLIVAGGGPEADAVARRAAASPVAASIELIGPVERRDVPGVLARADVSCQPAHGEPFGWSAVEAMACGLPVVATDSAGLASVVPDAAGVKVPVEDPPALAAALAALLADPERREAAGRAARETVAERFAWDRVIDTIEAVLVRTVTEPRRGAVTMTRSP